MNTLKPCPFCGWRGITISWHIWSNMDGGETQKNYRVECDGCGCTSPYDLPSYESAVEYWNKRYEEARG